MNQHEPRHPGERPAWLPPLTAEASRPPETPGGEEAATEQPDVFVPRRHYTEAAGGYGEAFLAYLDLDLAEPVQGSEVTDFLERYIGYFPDRASFVESQLDALGWRTLIEDFCASNGFMPAELTWSTSTFWRHLSEKYGLGEQFGGVHAFRR